MTEPTRYVIRLTVAPNTPQAGFIDAVNELLHSECPAVGYLDYIEGWTVEPEDPAVAG